MSVAIPGPATSGEDLDPRTFERVPPQDLEAEQSVLGGMLLSKDAIDDVVEVLQASDFYRPAHETVFRAILDVHGKGEPADPITVAAYLTTTGELAKVGGAAYLHTLVQQVPTAANAEYYAEIVYAAAVARNLVVAGTAIAASGYARDGDSDELVERAQERLYGVVRHRGDESLLDASEGMDDTFDDIEAAGMRKKGELTGVPTGFTDLDSLTLGLQPGQLVLIAGRPAMGKSTLGLDIARAASLKHGLTSAFFSLEMSRKELHMRLLSAEGSVALHHIRSGQLDEAAWNRMAKAKARVDAGSLLLDDSPELTAMSIRAKARRLKQRGTLDLVVIDYLQLLQYGGGRRPESRQQEVSDISRQLKLMAKELEVPVVALSQLNRGPEQRTDKKPQVSDLRESGSLEQDADVVILLHREDQYEKESSRAGEADLIVGKHRNGPTAIITTAFQGHYSRFVDMNRT
ncbi:replicative DNA helicase (plasmid) [Streptomyces olivoreticuli]|uniref:replicative DNA helicase n=1 Tax=Streptomyces olivoreticuli TaxID=68246 RepID=UPI00265955A0|nr:replicative DNA helicase [Streptomyces olivoreticuli]WKK27801.1 replicative DNA helicase [Streptomyces olivoreticuli]